MRTDMYRGADRQPKSDARTDAEDAPYELVAELAAAGLLSIDMDVPGGPGISLTTAGERVARTMALHGGPYALVLLSALTEGCERVD